MKKPITLLLIFCVNLVCAQTLLNEKAETRAVIFGISDYEEPLIPDLNYADRDAKAFANWLRSPAGGNTPDKNIILYTNQEATNAQMILSFDWLIDESKEGDRAFIYFSGHGDVERITKYNNGYLLGYDSPPSVYGAGAFSVNYLKDIIANLSDNGVQVFLISDACRAGKLAGSTAGGSQVTALRLSKQFANEIKILSCQPDEYSIEGKQWGGGRGCFSYHLENALYGFADKNKDAAIDLMELRRYLEEKVSSEADPEVQFPMVEGPAKKRIAFVDEEILRKKMDEFENSPTEFLAVDSKGLEEMILTELDSNIQSQYQQFLVTIDSNHLMSPEEKCANHYYSILIENPALEKLHGMLKRKFVVALMDEGQQIINKVMRTDQKQLDDIYGDKVDYDHLPGYYNRASEILGENHYTYFKLKALELFFKAKTIRADNYPDKVTSELNEERRGFLMESLKYDSTFAMSYFDLAYTYPRKHPGIVKNLQRVLEIAPNWTLANANLGYQSLGNDTINSIELLEKAISLDSSFLQPYRYLGIAYENMGLMKEGKTYYNKYVGKIKNKFQVDRNSVTAWEYSSLGNILLLIFKKPKEAKKYLLIGAEKCNRKGSGLMWHLALAEQECFEFNNSIQSYMDGLKAGLSENLCYFHIGNMYFHFLNEIEKSKVYYNKLPEKYRDYFFIKRLFFTGNFEEVLKVYEQNPEGINQDNYLYYLLAEAARQLGKKEMAEQHYQYLIDSVKVKEYPNKDHMFKLIALHRMNEIEKFNQFLQELESNYDKDYVHEGPVYMAGVYAQLRNKEKAIHYLYKAQKKGWKPWHLNVIDSSLCSPFLDPIRESTEYYEFVEKHYPYYLEVATKIPYKSID